MKHLPLIGGMSLLAMFSLTGCINNDYDLSDIDTTTEIKVNDLVLPVNFDVITLGDIITIEEGSEFNEVTINGNTFYAVNKGGDFSSDKIHIPGFSAPAPTLSPAKIEFGNLSQNNLSTRSNSSYVLELSTPISRNLSYTFSNIDKSVVSLSEIGTEVFSIVIDFSLPASLINLMEVELRQVKVALPRGLNVISIPPTGNYDVATGELNVANVPMENGKCSICLEATGINLAANEAGIKDHSLTLNTNVNIVSAAVKVSPLSTTDMITDNISLDVKYSISELVARSFTGEIQYALEGNGLNISPVELNDIPDFLAGEGTDIVLANPQIYLSLNNPVAEQSLKYQTGIALTPLRGNIAGEALVLDEGTFNIGYDKGIAGPYNFCLSPSVPTLMPEAFSNSCTPVKFSALSYIISGKGIPQKINIDLLNPQIPTQLVTDFPLNTDLPRLEGNWELLAPLALKGGSGSKIIYTDRLDGWNDEDVDAITITSLELTMTANSQLSLNAELSGYPIDKTGHRIPGVTIKPVTIKANTPNQEVKIIVEGTVNHLDGFEFTAIVNSDSDEALSPHQTITLENIRARVSGNYTKEL